VVGQQNADIADTLQLRDVAMATIFAFLYMVCTLAPSCLVLVIGQPPKEYHADGFQQLHAISKGAGCVEQVSF